ncbi:MAG: hypothetical protein K2X44_04920 [Magnetospirillum sp.]|nr:hypothetical protein [Magnetospirillum sp.]
MSDYPVIVERDAAGGFVLRIPALCLVVVDATLDRAWTRLETEKAELIERHRRIGAEGDLPAPVQTAAGDRDLRRFALKAAIIAVMAGVIVAGAAFSFAYAVREPLRKVGAKLGRAAIAQVETGLRQAASEDMTPERQEELRRLVAEVAPKLKPYVAELRPLLAEACP